MPPSKKVTKEVGSGESEPSAAGGGWSEVSMGQRSTDAKALCRRRQMSGTATGKRCVELLPISSRSPLRTPPGRFASVKSSDIDFAKIVAFIYSYFNPIA